ncbi:urea transporter [Acetobacteraceae bacterium]|nr:urea transporter [Acetobacteraceae bacterium]
MKIRFGLLWHFYCKNYRVVYALDILLKGYSQVMFQSNSLTGLFFFIGIFWSGCVSGVPQIALGSLLGTFIATLCAYCFTQDKLGLRLGLYGYNGCLVGIALPTFLVISPMLWAWIIFGSALSTFLIFMMRSLGIKQVAILTAPFVFSSWIGIVFSHFLGHCSYLSAPTSSADHNVFLYSSEAIFQSISEVFLKCFSVIIGLAVRLCF